MPDSKLNKKIKNAELHLKRAEQRKSNPELIAEHRRLLEKLYTQKALNKAEHDG